MRLLADLLVNGFSIQESFVFMEKLREKQLWAVTLTQANLARGLPLYESFRQVGFTSYEIAQLSLAEVHGDFSGTLTAMAAHLADAERQRRGFAKVMTYPSLLLLFLVGMMFGLKWFILPQLSGIANRRSQHSPAVLIIEWTPVCLFILLCLTVLAFFGLRLYFSRKPAVFQARWLTRLPFLKTVLTHYYTSFFALEWGKLMQQGLEFKQIITVMMYDGSTPLMKELAVILRDSLEQGISVDAALAAQPFLLKGIETIIRQGEATGNLGAELTVYGTRLWQQLMKRLERWFQLLQPLVFLLVALLIISVYGALLLPVYDGMEELI